MTLVTGVGDSGTVYAIGSEGSFISDTAGALAWSQR